MTHQAKSSCFGTHGGEHVSWRQLSSCLGLQGGLGDGIISLLAGCAEKALPYGLHEASPAGVTSLLQVLLQLTQPKSSSPLI